MREPVSCCWGGVCKVPHRLVARTQPEPRPPSAPQALSRPQVKRPLSSVLRPTRLAVIHPMSLSLHVPVLVPHTAAKCPPSPPLAGLSPSLLEKVRHSRCFGGGGCGFPHSVVANVLCCAVLCVAQMGRTVEKGDDEPLPTPTVQGGLETCMWQGSVLPATPSLWDTGAPSPMSCTRGLAGPLAELVKGIRLKGQCLLIL
jgi:hypothetical protein